MTPGTPTSFRLPARTNEQLNLLGKHLGMTRVQVMIVAIDRFAREELAGPETEGFPPIFYDLIIPAMWDLHVRGGELNIPSVAESIGKSTGDVASTFFALRQHGLITWPGPEDTLNHSTVVKLLATEPSTGNRS